MPSEWERAAWCAHEAWAGGVTSELWAYYTRCPSAPRAGLMSRRRCSGHRRGAHACSGVGLGTDLPQPLFIPARMMVLGGGAHLPRASWSLTPAPANCGKRRRSRAQAGVRRVPGTPDLGDTVASHGSARSASYGRADQLRPGRSTRSPWDVK